MREHCTGFTFSAVVHVLIVAAFFMLPVEKYSKPKNMLIDFTLEKSGRTGGYGGDAAGVREGRGQTKERGTRDEGRGRIQEQRAESREHRAKSVEASATPKGNVSVLTAGTADAKDATSHYSDPQGQVVVRGNIGAPGAGTGKQGSYSAEKGMPDAVGGGQGRMLDYGRGGPAERSFAFIRENIMRNITYPERARRMGWEGKVLLSFVVLENGTVEALKIVNSSGFRALDENAKEAVLKTRFSQSIPYRMAVVLPVEYRLE